MALGMKTYGDHIPFFEREIATLGSKPFNLSFGQLFAALGSETLLLGDEACRIFASTLQWPEVADIVRFDLCMRLDCARCYCQASPGLEACEEEQSGRELLESILIEYWHDVGKRDWLYENYCLAHEERQEYRSRTFGQS